MANAIDDEGYIVRRVRLRDLRVFFTVTRRGSMAKAAADLGITQPAVSRVIGELERTLGVRLLDRSSQGVEPTTYGRALLKRGGVAFDELKQALRDIEFLASPNVGEVRVACPESIAATILPPVIERLFRRYPGIVPSVVPGVPLDFSDVLERKVDLFVGRLFPPFVQGQLPEGLNAEILFDDQVVFAAGVQNRWAHRRRIDLADLIDEPWILAEPNTWIRAFVAKAFEVHGLPMPRISLMTLSTHLRINLVATGNFITVFPRSVMHLYAQRFAVKELPVEIPEQSWPVAILTLKNRMLSPVVERFIQCVREVAQQMVARPAGGQSARKRKSNVA
jgi:DNA-binding transcriptional LysR family regulator